MQKNNNSKAKIPKCGCVKLEKDDSIIRGLGIQMGFNGIKEYCQCLPWC